MPDPTIQDFTVLAATTTAGLTYSGVREVLQNQPLVLRGTFDPRQIARVTLVAEDKYPLGVVTDATGHWQVRLDKGFQAPGARWLRLSGLDRAGKVIQKQVVYVTVSTDALTVGQALTLKVLQDTLFKSAPLDSSQLSADQKVTVPAGRSFSVSRYGFIDGYLRVELTEAIAPIGTFGCFYEEHVQLRKGSETLRFDADDVPTTPLNAQLLITTTTFLKASLTDSALLPANRKSQLLQGQTVPITGYACVKGHYRVTLAQAIAGFGNSGYLYWQHGVIKWGDRTLAFEPDALTVTATKPTLFKKRPLDSSKLAAREKADFPAGKFYGVSSYALEGGHIKVALTEQLPNFGNTGYVFPSFVQMKRGGKSFTAYPSQVELNVPYFSQRDNPRYAWATCNVTSIAMAMYYFGVRSKGSGQLEDELLQWCLNKYGEGSQTDHSVLSQLIQTYGFRTSFSTTRKWLDVKEELISRRPVILGGDFTASGHIVCLIGFNNQGYLVNDPWGNALSGYTNTQGRRLLYPYSYMNRVAGPDGSVWAHFLSR